MGTLSPTARSLKWLRENGYKCEVVERFAFGKRHDLFGFGDIFAIREAEVLIVQTTSRGNVSARVKKITVECEENLGHVRKAGIRVVVHGWGKLKAGWTLREVDLS
jgi:hypothetical protein